MCFETFKLTVHRQKCEATERTPPVLDLHTILGLNMFMSQETVKRSTCTLKITEEEKISSNILFIFIQNILNKDQYIGLSDLVCI